MKMTIWSLIALVLAAPAFAQQDRPLEARVAAMKMTLPDGFKATLFAGEPDVVQPIAFCFDDRGRLWVAECLSYPNWEAEPKKGKDRVVILEDTDGDGVHDKRTVFADNLQNLSGINYGFGGIWLCSTPNLLFIPIKDDKPGEPEIVLDGWSLDAKHNVFNSPTWGPDGWLYGCNGIIATSYVGRPGTPMKDRVPINCGVWRYHPTKKKFEAVAHGTTNPWGLDFDEHGEMFITNCVIDHLWHIVPGGHYERMYGEDLNPHVYKLMPSICDHKHWGGGSWTSSRRPNLAPGDSPGAKLDAYEVHSAAGGGHAHVGCMIYLGDNWPQRYRGGVFMCNLHGNRINHDILERNGSTYVARHAKDFMLANDPWFRGMALQYGPDGGVYVSDWTDTGECHNYKIADKTNGRIFKITYGDAKPWKGDLAKLSDLELAKLQTHKNEWMARHARRILQERAVNRKVDAEATEILREELFKKRSSLPIPQNDPEVAKKVRVLLSLYVVDALDEKTIKKVASLTDEPLRVWLVRIFAEKGALSEEATGQLYWLVRDSTPLMRLHFAANVHRSNDFRFFVLRALLSDFEGDKNDHYLSLMYWYAVQPLVTRHPTDGVILSQWDIRIPMVRENIARGVVATSSDRQSLEELIQVMIQNDLPLVHRDMLRGIRDGLDGRRQVSMPKSWKGAYPIFIESPLPEVRERALALAVQFGDERAFTLLRKIVPDRAASTKEREAALKTLLFQQKADLVPILHDLLADNELRGPAIRGLAAFEDAKTPKLLVQGYAKWNADERADAIGTLSSRTSFALILLDAVERKDVPRGDINSFTIRQLQALKSKEVADSLTKVIGEVRSTSAEKVKLMAKYKSELKPDVLKKANLANGRALYNKACASCHRLFGEGGDIGPDLTGSQRTNLDYILENVLDPSAIVPREYQVTLVETKNGRTLSGIVKKENDASITLQLANEVVIVPKSDIAERTPTKQSMMPDGAFEPLRLEEVRDLVAYLAAPVQVPASRAP